MTLPTIDTNAVQTGYKKPQPGATCTHCGAPAVLVTQKLNYCTQHYRLVQMRHNCYSRKVAVPPLLVLAKMMDDLIAVGIICQPCGRTMNWLAQENASTVVTLQHDRDGGFRLICSRCNAQHRLVPGDEFYNIPPGHKRCPNCGKNKPLDQFYRDSSTVNGVQSYCALCIKKLRNRRKKPKVSA